MKSSEAFKVGDLLKIMMESDGSRKEFDEHRVLYLWSEIVGPVINKATSRRYMENGTMHVFIMSAPLKSELSFVQASLVDKLNEAVGKKIVKKIIFH